MSKKPSQSRSGNVSLGHLAAQTSNTQTDRMILSTFASKFTQAILRRAYRMFDGDLTLFLVFGEIAQYNVARAMRTLNLHEIEMGVLGRTDVLRALEQQQVAPCNALSISEATGIPRETVRRKVKELEQRNMLYREGPRKLTLTPHAIEQFHMAGLDVMQDFQETAHTIQILQDALTRRHGKTAPPVKS